MSVQSYEPVSDYWKNWEKPEETVRATCEFDFLGYSESTGRIELTQKAGDLVTMLGDFTGISPGLHGLKIQEFGDLEQGCASTGDVFNPFDAPHGDSHMDVTMRRVGDIEQLIGRWTVDAEYRVRDALVELSGPNSVIGRSMVLYERQDDWNLIERREVPGREGRYRRGMGKPIACCVVGLAEGTTPEKKAVPKELQLPFKPSYSPAWW